MPQDIMNQVSRPWLGDVGAGPFNRGPLGIVERIDHIWAFNDFRSAEDYTAGAAPWTETDIGVSGGSIALSGATPGLLTIDCGVTTQKGFQTQLTGVPLSTLTTGFTFNHSAQGPTANGKNTIWGWGCRVNVNTASAGHILVGLGTTDASIQTPATGLPAPAVAASMFGFNAIAGAVSSFSFRTTSVTNTVLSPFTMQDGVFVDFAMRAVQISTYASGGTVLDTTDGFMEFFINGKKVAVHSGYLGQSTVLAPFFSAINGAGAIDLIVDYMWQYVQRVSIST